ncbi:MAG: sigma-54-dependent Fis family transcriptional regulator [Planctomycetes bacterium]|nr:sigma-54-dependent Fis family transcriptional regulator [Planctomycetota bacterium]
MPEAPQTVLVVDDDPQVRRVLGAALGEAGYAAIEAHDGREAFDRLGDGLSPDLIILDVKMPGMEGTEVLRRLRTNYASIPVVMLTGIAGIHLAVECMKNGAQDFQTKPFEVKELVACVQNSIRSRTWTPPEAAEGQEASFHRLVGTSGRIQEVYGMIEKSINSTVNILIEGESGTGKELVAKAIHDNGPRRAGPFVAVNCSAIPDALMESELFGHEKGAFTGATARHVGVFERAQGGTLFLDEVSEINPENQAKMLRAIQEREIQRVGGRETVRVDVRILAASNQALGALVGQGRFRQDLYYRLAVFPITMPPLRERRDDIPLLCSYFLRLALRKEGRGKQIEGITDEAMAVLRAYRWPGNIRELQNVVDRAVILSPGPRIGMEALPTYLREAVAREGRHRGQPGEAAEDPRESILPFVHEERRIIERALRLTRGNVEEASRRLGLGRATLYRKIKKFGIEVQRG